MSARPPDGPLTWNVAGLLADVTGTARTYPVAGVELDLDETELAQPIDGEVQLARTNRGILAHARLGTALKAQCSRCLLDITVPVRIDPWSVSSPQTWPLRTITSSTRVPVAMVAPRERASCAYVIVRLLGWR